jgi:hypothetical protein
MVNSPDWVSGGNAPLGYPLPGTVDEGKTINGATVPSVPVGTLATFRDEGTTRLGSCSFIFLPGVTSTVAGDVVSYRQSLGTDVPGDVNDGAATARWAGTANTGYPLAVATAATNLQSKWGWYQLQGAAIINTSGTITAGNAVYFGQVATLQNNAAVGGKQVLGIQASSATDVPDTGQAIFTINNPVVQSQIT